MLNKLLVILLGPTGVGKTKTAIKIAKQLKTEIISCDSRQVYKELSIGTDVPSMNELTEIKHHFIQNKSIHDYYNASMFEFEIMDLLNNLFKNNDILLMVGGSGLYVDAICKGIDDLPTIEPEVRKKLLNQLETEGIESLRMQLKRVDPVYYARVDLKNSKRILKALEVNIMTGKPYSSYLTKPVKSRPFRILKIGLNMERKQLYEKINNRVDQMIKDGLLKEVKKYYNFKHLNALNTVGYKEIFNDIDGNITFEKSVELIKCNTRKYARKQLTWFRKYNDVKWFKPGDFASILHYIGAAGTSG